MSLSRYYPFAPPDLEKVLMNPDDFSHTRTLKSVQQKMGKYYRTPWQKMTRVGKKATETSPADLSANSVTARVKDKILTEVKIIKGEFSRIFDNLLLTYARTNYVATERVLGFWQNACYFLVAEDKKGLQTCRRLAEREEAYRRAMERLSAKIPDPGFKFDNGASILLRKIFQDECKDIRKREGRKQRSFEEAMIFGQDLPTDVATHFCPPTELLPHDLRQLQKYQPRCFDLYVQVYIVGMSYKELEERFGKSSSALMNEAYRCKKRLMTAFSTLTK